MAVVIRNQRFVRRQSVEEIVAAQVRADFAARRVIQNVRSARELRKSLIERGILKVVDVRLSDKEPSDLVGIPS